jgi:putative phage-type endonuclease
MSAAVLLGHYEPGSDTWHAARRDGLGGSEIAAVLGLSPFESRFSLWHRKQGLVGAVADNDVMYWGRALEGVIADEFGRRHPELAGLPAGMYRNRERPWQLGQPDRFAGDDLLEVKTARYDDEWGTEGTAEIPVYYRAQALWYLDCLQRRRCHVAVLIAGSDYREYLVELDADAMPDVIAMREAAAEFMATLRTGQRPDIDDHTATYQAVRELHPDIDPTTVDLPADIAVAYLDALAAHKDAEAAKREATARVADAMGSAQKARHIDRVIATRRAKGDGHPYVQAANGAADQHRSAA